MLSRKLLVVLVLSMSAMSVPFLSFQKTSRVQAVSDPISNAVGWLKSHQLADGSYGSLTEHQTAAALHAMWLFEGDSADVLKALSFLKQRLEDSSSWFWNTSFGEADVPGAMLYAVASTRHTSSIDISTVASRLLSFQQSNGGFKGYYDSVQQAVTESSVDTALVLLGLTASEAISPDGAEKAVSFLFTLQNSDGSFNLTRTTRSNSLYSLAPDPATITSLVLLALKATGRYNVPTVPTAVGFVATGVSTQFSGHVYTAGISGLALNRFGRIVDARTARSFVVSQQNSDGGFSDMWRSSWPSPNPLDTGWATVSIRLSGLLGDVDFDGDVDLDDLILVYLHQFSTVPRDLGLYDVDADGNVDLDDLVTVYLNQFTS